MPNASGSGTSPSPAGSNRARVRLLGAVLVPLIFGESVLGIVSAGSTPSALLVVHVAIGLGLAGVGVACVLLARTLEHGASRWATLGTGLALLATASTGAFFLVDGIGQGAIVDRGLAFASLVGAVGMLAYGRGGTANTGTAPPSA